MDYLLVALTAFVLVVTVELPDKTFVATLVLATRYPALPVWLGVSAAFAVQSAVAVGAGTLLARLPRQPIALVAAGLFAIGALVLLRGARQADVAQQEQERQYADKVAVGRRGWRAAGASFLVLFTAEWGDLSQLLTAGLVASGQPAVPVLIGSWLALVTVSGGAVLLGRWLLRRIRLTVVRYLGASVCVALAVLTAVTALR
ncbi:TMEM165/GDT1 family protein [Plantactinospora sp. GCM10030261]|uniref:TMEM165/GDT1 family protein n=1 Tax=Plantactinospora sp. GCM10030261 TaxID=3273420 RepID=UPI00360973D5